VRPVLSHLEAGRVITRRLSQRSDLDVCVKIGKEMNLYLGTDDGLAVFQGQKEEWRPRYLRLAGQHVTAAATAGARVWAGTTEGLWRSHDQGKTWLPVQTGVDKLHVRALAIAPDPPDTLLVGGEPATVWLGRDGGETWVEAPDVARLRDEHSWSLPYSPAAGCIRSFALAGRRVYAAAEVGGVLRSDDAGATWQLLSGGIHADVHDVGVRPADPDLVFAATGGGRYRTRDSGQNWQLIGDGYTRAVWLDPDRPEIVLSGPARYVGAMGRLERSTDGGDTWALASDGFKVPMSDMIERFAGADSHVLALTSDGALYTAKRGLWMWRRLELGLPPVRAMAVEGT
jgi:photosystem II stability/assembly factor-like uncharacterized protein